MPDPTQLLQTPPFLDPSEAASNTQAGQIPLPQQTNGVDFSNLITQMRGNPGAAASPQTDPLGDFIKNNATKTVGDYLQEKFGNSPAQIQARKDAGQSETKHKLTTFLQALGGRNFRGEANQEFDNTQDRLKTAVTEGRNQDLAAIAAEKARIADEAVKNAKTYKDAYTEVLKSKAANDAEKIASNERIKTEANDLTRLKNEALAGNMKAQQEYNQRLASIKERGVADKPEDVARMMATGADGKLDYGKYTQHLQEIMRIEAAKNRPVNLGSTMTESTDTNGNPIHQRSSNFGIMNGAGGISPLGTSPAAHLGSPIIQGGGGPVVTPGPANAAQALGLPGATPPVNQPITQHNSSFYDGTPPSWEQSSYKGQFSNAEIADMRKKTSALVGGMNGMRESRANLANALINGDAAKYNGIIAGSGPVEQLRSLAGTVGPNEALSKPLNYDALYGKLGGSVKGAFRNSEIAQAQNSQGRNIDDPFNTLAIHAANELMQQAGIANTSKQFVNRNVSTEEATTAAQTELARYMGEVAKVASMKGTAANNPTKAAYIAAHEKDLQLHTIQQAIDDLRTGKKLVSVGVSKDVPTKSKSGGINDVSVEDLLNIYHGK